MIICGDFNTAHREIDLKNPKENQKYSGFLPEERAWIDKYLDHGFIDIYREMNPENEQYTWWTYRVGARERNIGWRIDYFLISEVLRPAVNSAIVMDKILGSDHCPIELDLDVEELKKINTKKSL
jgi:exodeoxyribonuclease-3